MKTLRTASLGSDFSDSYKKECKPKFSCLKSIIKILKALIININC